MYFVMGVRVRERGGYMFQVEATNILKWNGKSGVCGWKNGASERKERVRERERGWGNGCILFLPREIRKTSSIPFGWKYFHPPLFLSLSALYLCSLSLSSYFPLSLSLFSSLFLFRPILVFPLFPSLSLYLFVLSLHVFLALLPIILIFFSLPPYLSLSLFPLTYGSLSFPSLFVMRFLKVI